MYMWSCAGENGGNTMSCHANKTVISVTPTLAAGPGVD